MSSARGVRMRASGRLAAGAAAICCLLAVSAGCTWWNQKPTASFTRSPGYGDAPLSVFLDASGSADPDGTIVEHRWIFGDGSTGVGAVLTHTFRSPGVYQVELTVIDDRGSSAQMALMVSVSDPASLPEEGVSVGLMAPDFTLEDLDGDPVSLSQLRGHVVLLTFWSSSCSPCRLAMPHLESLRHAYAADGLVHVGVSQDETWDAVSGYIAETGLTEMITLWGSAHEANAVRVAFGVTGVPHTFILDRQGVIRHRDHPNRVRSYHIEPWL